MKQHTRIQLVPKSLTLYGRNGEMNRDAYYLHIFTDIQKHCSDFCRQNGVGWF